VDLHRGYKEMGLNTAADDIKNQIEVIHKHAHAIRENIAKMDEAEKCRLTGTG